MGSSPRATARSWPPHGVSTVCHSIGCLTIISTMSSSRISAPLLECLLPFLLLSPGCDRAVSHLSLLTAVQPCFPRGASTRALSALRWVGWSQLELSVSDWGQPRALLTETPLYPPLPMPGHLHPTHCASGSVSHAHLGI